ncbi:MAG: putative DNA base hypermodification protein [Acidimicrobiaceae bacterium]|nr:putative DNA base hypermodification protein [Acidimicrobiaceae bacterium]MCY4281070.1 putative DNA base hypermodification protein [Acidimicrobiaceae bacterium]
MGDATLGAASDYSDSSPCSDRGTWRLRLGGHWVVVTEVFQSYWFLAAERQKMFFRRVSGELAPWTDDAILAGHRFTNAYRASDRVSQYLLQHVIYDRARDVHDTVLRILLFKIFNRIDTWEHLIARVGEPEVSCFDHEACARALDERLEAGERLYSAAYIMPNPNFGFSRKHHNHLALLDSLLRDGAIPRIARAASLQALYLELLAVPSFGSFLAFQYAIDLNYSPHFHFNEMDFVVAGPGAIRGIAKCFQDTGGLEPEQVIASMAVDAAAHLNDQSTPFKDLDGRPLHLIDYQNLFCEVDKYARIRHPERSNGGPSRVKQRYSPDGRPLCLGYPPKWGLRWSAESPSRVG